MRIKSIILAAFLLVAAGSRADAQTDSLSLPAWDLVSMDDQQRLYLTLNNGDLIRRSADGEPLVYSPIKKARISLLDVTNSLRPFLFYEDLQEYVILDRFLTETSRYSLASYTSYAGIAAPALNNQLWVVDMVDFSIKKIDPGLGQVAIRIPLRQILDPDESEFDFLREYQNLLFLTDRQSGIYIFDNMGNLLRRIPAQNVLYLHFDENRLYYQTEESPDTVYLEDIYSGKQDTLKLPRAARSVIFTEKSMWLFGDKEGVEIVKDKD